MQNFSTLTDDGLVMAYANGDDAAFDALLQRHETRVFSYILHVVKNKDLADDLFQETFVKAIITIRQGRYTESGKFGSWLTRIAHNLIIDHFRQQKSENALSTDDDETMPLLNRKELSDPTVEDLLVGEQIDQDVRRIIMALPDPQREVLVMRYYRGMSFKEIADQTNVSINTALGRMRYALINMRRLAEEHNISLQAV